MTRIVPIVAVVAIGALLALSGCGGGDSAAGEAGSAGTGSAQSAEGGATGAGKPSVDGVISPGANPELGEIFVNDLGLTVYVFEGDEGGKSACYGECAKTWLPMTTTAAGQISGVTDEQAALLGKTTRKGGTLQVTYAGHPLYTYADDQPGETNGQGIDSFGGKWYALSPEGTEVTG